MIAREKRVPDAWFGIAALMIILAMLSCSETPQAPVSTKTVEGKAQDFMLKDLKGGKFLLSAQQGKPVLLIFATTWCPTCRSEIPRYKKIYETYDGRGLVVANVNIQEPSEKVSRFAEKYQLPYKVLLDETGRVAEAYRVVGVPTMILIDRDGRILSRQSQAIDGLLSGLLAGS